jgi:hypothetical protein
MGKAEQHRVEQDKMHLDYDLSGQFTSTLTYRRIFPTPPVTSSAAVWHCHSKS